MVESMIRYSKSGSSTNALKRLFQTPFFAHRRKRWNTVFQLPSGTNQPKHSVHEQSIVLAVPPFVTFLTWNKRLDASPLPVRKCPPNQNRLLSCDLESHLRVGGNP